MPRRAARLLTAAASLAATAAAATSPPGAPGQAGTPAAPAAETVTAGSARSLGEPAAAQDSAVTAVTATSFGAAGAQAEVWTRPADGTAWRQAGAVLPAGFGSSYDPAAAAAPGGPLLVAAGTAPPGEQCIANGSVAIASVDSKGRLGAARLVSDQRGTGSFDDRPTVAVGQNGMVWVAWSQGPDADSCQNVGTGDRIEVAVSRDGGRTFDAPVALPADGGHSAFGVRLAPLLGGEVAVSWTETMRTGGQGVLVSVLGADGRAQQPTVALTGQGPPLNLPGASFYDFPAGDIAALPGGKLMVAAPFWVSGRSVVKLASGTPGGQWQATDLSPPAGTDLLLPALGVLSAVGGVRLLCAVHTRLGDRLGYDWADVTVGAQGPSVSHAGLTALTSAPPGPGFFEIGEELALAPTQGGLLTAVVVGGRNGAALEAAVFSAPPPLPRQAGAGTGARAGVGAGAGAHATSMPTARASDGRSSGSAVTAGWLGAAALACAAAVGALVLRRRRHPWAARHGRNSDKPRWRLGRGLRRHARHATQRIFRCPECGPRCRRSPTVGAMARRNIRHSGLLPLAVLLAGVVALAACSAVSAPARPRSHQATASPGTPAGASSAPGGGTAPGRRTVVGIGTPGTSPLPAPGALPPFPGTPTYAGEGTWQPTGRLVAGQPAVYETSLVPPGGTQRAGIAWMDTHLLSARLYSGSLSPGGGPYKYTAPVAPTAASSLVAAFNGGFKMADAHGGYYTEHRMVRPLVPGGASLVIYADGSATVGAWGTDVTMTPSVVAVRQNLFPLVVNGTPTARASTRTWRVWGGTCPCGAGKHGAEFQWRSGLGVTADGALVYVAGSQLDPLQVAGLLARAGVVRGMELDINPSWPVFASFKPAAPDGLAAPSNGARLINTYRGPATFFDPTYARDFITMSARPGAGSG